MRRRLLEMLAGLSTRHPVAVVVATLAITAAALPAALRAARNIETDFSQLIPREEGVAPVGSLYLKTMDLFGVTDTLYVVVKLDSGELSEAARPLVDGMASSLASRSDCGRVVYKVGAEAADVVRERIAERAYLFLESQDLHALAGKLSTDGIAAQMKRNRAVLDQSLEAFRKSAARDPLGLYEVFAARLGRHGRDIPSDDPEGYFLSPDRTLYVILARPAGSCRDLAFSRRLLAEARSALDEAWRTFASSHPAEAARLSGRYSTHLGGGHAMAVSANATLSRDLALSSIISALAVFAIYALAFRRPTAALMAAVPLLIAVVWTLAVAGVVFNRLSLISGSFASMLFGLGIDYATYVYNHYTLGRRRGLAPEEAMREGLLATGGGIFFGCLTTAIAFFGITVTSFRGLSEIGFLAGTGILLSMLVMTTMLPSMLILRARLGERPESFRNMGSFGLGRVAGFIRSWRRAIVVTTAVATAAGTVYLSLAMTTAFFNSDFRALGDPGDPAMLTGDLLTSRFNVNLSETTILASAPTEEEALERSRELAGRLDALVRDGRAMSYRSVLSLLPAPSSQRAAVEFLRSADLARVAADVRAAATAEGINPSAFREFFEWLDKVRASLDSPRLITSAELAGTSAEDLLGRYLAADGGSFRVATRWSPSKPAGRSDHPRTWYALVAKDLGVGAPSSPLGMTSPTLAGYELRDMVYSDFSLITGSVFVAVLVSLVALFRSLAKAIAAFAPVFSAVVIMLSILMLSGHRLNYLNVVVLPMIIGVGIDYGIHVTHRFVHGADTEEIVVETGRAIVVAATTTIAGFGALMVAKYRGLSSLGFVASLGVAACLVTSMVALPAALEWLVPSWRGSAKEAKPGSGGDKP